MGLPQHNQYGAQDAFWWALAGLTSSIVRPFSDVDKFDRSNCWTSPSDMSLISFRLDVEECGKALRAIWHAKWRLSEKGCRSFGNGKGRTSRVLWSTLNVMQPWNLHTTTSNRKGMVTRFTHYILLHRLSAQTRSLIKAFRDRNNGMQTFLWLTND